MILIGENKGFALEFANGYSISVQIGIGNYCARNRPASERISIREKGIVYPEMETPLVSSSDAEVAIFNKEGGCVTLQEGSTDVDSEDFSFDVMTVDYTDANQIASLIDIVCRAADDDDIRFGIGSRFGVI